MEPLTNLCFEWEVFWSRYNAKYSPEHLYTSRFARLYEMKPLLAEKPGPRFVCGIGPYGRPLYAYPTPKKPKLGNLLDIGPSQCGKSTRQIGEILDWEGSIIVNDIKEELRPATAGWRSRIGSGKTFTVNVSGHGNKYDPLEGRVTESQLYTSACHLLHSTNERDMYWIITARKMLTQIFRASRITGERPLLFAAQLFRLGLNEVAARLNAVSAELAHYFLQAPYTPYKDFEDNRARYDAWTTLTNTLYPVLTDEILPTLSGSDFTAKDILFSAEPVTVYFCWPEEDLHALEPLTRLIWESLVSDLKRTYRLSPHLVRQRVLVALDEAGVTKLSRLPEDVATLNGRGCSFSLSAQDIEQFKTHYGESRARSLLNNIETKVVHRLASLDTAKYFTQWLDHKSGFASSQSIHETSETEGKSEREVPLRTIRQLAEMDDEDVIVFHCGVPPIQASRLDLDRLPTLAARKNVAPPPLPALPAPAELPKFPAWTRGYLAQGPYWMPPPRYADAGAL